MFAGLEAVDEFFVQVVFNWGTLLTMSGAMERG
jgi:hypothetical protein